uniref:Uncharacterized protein n=1 Tax=Tetranychus urticae TaxID=32264 RepID=T1KWP9_TETUR
MYKYHFHDNLFQGLRKKRNLNLELILLTYHLRQTCG